MIDEINRHQPRHILTLEDPIEFLHRSRRSLIQQREIGRDSHSFDAALRAALREDPDVILLGELRDVATIRLALTAAETGHLVLATLHTRSAPQAVERLVDVFPAEEKPYVRAQLAGSLQAVIAQKLMRRPGGGRVAIFEVLTATAAVSNLIREGKTHQLASVLQTGAQSGMQTFEQGLQQRIDAGVLGIVLAKGRGLTQLPFEPAFEDHHRRGGIHAAFVERAEAAAVEQVGSRFHGAQALVMQIDLDAEAAVQAVGELARPAVTGCSVPSMFSGRPTTTRSGCHSFNSFSIFSQSGEPSCALKAGRARALPVNSADGRADAFGAEVEGDNGAVAHQACPAWLAMLRMSIPRRFPASRQRLAIGVRNRMSVLASMVSRAFSNTSCSSWPFSQPA